MTTKMTADEAARIVFDESVKVFPLGPSEEQLDSSSVLKFKPTLSEFLLMYVMITMKADSKDVVTLVEAFKVLNEYHNVGL